MNDRPTIDDLLEALREYLLGEVAPAAADHRARYRALVAANVTSVIRRQLALAGDDQEELVAIADLLRESDFLRGTSVGFDALVEANRRLAEHIRGGAADEGDHARAVREVVRRQVERKLEVTNPVFLERIRKGEL